ncbi:hypothetical protein ABCR94_15050 [Streptomyces sp. 21So2-11]|uniref:hypothetical protein n=1 Tax=Streptomyces sp. 21So2-11 TaxID=3144408 RepID=UPI00321BB516
MREVPAGRVAPGGRRQAVAATAGARMRGPLAVPPGAAAGARIATGSARYPLRAPNGRHRPPSRLSTTALIT